MNLKNKLTTFFLGFVMCISAQKNNYPRTVITKGDTVIAFTREQALRITQINEENKTFRKVIINKDSVIQLNHHSLIIYDSMYRTTININNEYKGILERKNTELNTYVENEKILKKEIEKQKRQKTYAIIGGGAIFLISYITFLLK